MEKDIPRQKNVIRNIYKSEVQKRNLDITLFVLFVSYFFNFIFFYKKNELFNLLSQIIKF